MRAPVIAFNAGLLSARDYSAELCNMLTPTLVLSGTADRSRRGLPCQRAVCLYESQMLSCRLESIPGCNRNVLPWDTGEASCFHPCPQTSTRGLSLVLSLVRLSVLFYPSPQTSTRALSQALACAFVLSFPMLAAARAWRGMRTAGTCRRLSESCKVSYYYSQAVSGLNVCLK